MDDVIYISWPHAFLKAGPWALAVTAPIIGGAVAAALFDWSWEVRIALIIAGIMLAVFSAIVAGMVHGSWKVALADVILAFGFAALAGIALAPFAGVWLHH